MLKIKNIQFIAKKVGLIGSIVRLILTILVPIVRFCNVVKLKKESFTVWLSQMYSVVVVFHKLRTIKYFI